jgi:O-antigen/teichoic acid export membrane protein
VILEDASALDVPRLRASLSIQAALGKASRSIGTLSGFIALCDQATVSVTNFGTAVIIGRVCGKAELGLYSLAWTLIAMATGVISTLISSPYTVFGPQLSRSRRRRYLGSILLHQVFFSLVIALAIGTVAVLGSGRGWLSNSKSSVIATTAAVIGFASLREFIRSVSFAELRIGWAFLVDLTACLAQAAGIFLALHFGGLTVSRTYAIIGLSSALATGGWLVLRREMFRFDRRLILPDLRRNWRFGKWVLGSGLLWQGTGYLFPWVLAAFHGSSVTGLWAACSAIVALGNPVLLGLSNYALPKISNVYAATGILDMKRHVHHYSLMFTALLLPVVALMAGFGERILTRIYGQGYGGTSTILILLALNMLMITLAKPFSQGLFSMECARTDTFVNVVWVSLLIAAGIPAVRSYAALGAAVAMLGSSTVAVGIKIIAFARAVRRRS